MHNSKFHLCQRSVGLLFAVCCLSAQLRDYLMLFICPASACKCELWLFFSVNSQQSNESLDWTANWLVSLCVNATGRRCRWTSVRQVWHGAFTCSSVAVHDVTEEVGPRDWVMLLLQKPWQQKCGETDETSCGRVCSPGPQSLLQLLHHCLPLLLLLPNFSLLSTSAPPGFQTLKTWSSRRKTGELTHSLTKTCNIL